MRASSEIERAFREVSGHAVATLIRLFGDITLAEDAVQDAFVIASRRWPTDGVPNNPEGWIVTTAKNRAIDQVRRAARGRELNRSIARETEPGFAIEDDADEDDADEPGPVSDDRLRLIFTCCHPALRTEHQVALTLRLLGGLSVEDIAHAFVVNESTMAKRLVRAKYKIKAANIPYLVPSHQDLGDRLHSVLSVLYLIYNAGTSDLAERVALRIEAIRLSRAVVALLPNEPEAAGLLALMVLNESRVPARVADDNVVLLRDQDRSAWDQELIVEGHAIVRECVRIDRPGPFQLQAAIQAVHCNANSFDETDWPQILILYDHLATLTPSPVVALNRAIVVSEVDGPDAALRILDDIAPTLSSYAPLHAARAVQLRRLGRRPEASEAFGRAIEFATSDADRRHLARERDVLTRTISPTTRPPSVVD